MAIDFEVEGREDCVWRPDEEFDETYDRYRSLSTPSIPVDECYGRTYTEPDSYERRCAREDGTYSRGLEEPHIRRDKTIGDLK